MPGWGCCVASSSRRPRIGFHGHHNLGLGRGQLHRPRWPPAPTRIDGSAAGLGAGAGNTPLEVFAAVMDRMGVETGVDIYKLMDVAEDHIVPMMEHMVRVDRESLTLGYAGVYSSFLLFAKRAEQKYGISAPGRARGARPAGTVGGQEDMIEDVALDLVKSREQQAAGGGA
ncbi:MAG: hypothetical protein U5L11_03900 [Arhodomonas sp.]|nr:hypothetical protein [Arhodomonas sp.]